MRVQGLKSEAPIASRIGRVNLVLESMESATIPAYGERVEVAGGALNVVRSGNIGANGGAPVVLLSGLGTAAPVWTSLL